MVAACVFAFGCCLSGTAAAPSCFEACSFIFFSLGQSCIITYSVDTVPVLGGGRKRCALSARSFILDTLPRNSQSVCILRALL